jgi:hypothetical protein
VVANGENRVLNPAALSAFNANHPRSGFVVLVPQTAMSPTPIITDAPESARSRPVHRRRRGDVDWRKQLVARNAARATEPVTAAIRARRRSSFITFIVISLRK